MKCSSLRYVLNYSMLNQTRIFNMVLIKKWQFLNIFAENVVPAGSTKSNQYSIKFRLSPSKNVFVICLIESPLQRLENVFYFILKALFVLVLKFLSRSCRKNGLIRKIRLTSKLMTSQAGLQTIAKQTLPNISESKGKQTIKFGQLIA